MNINESAENYLETILILSKSHPVVRSVDVATELDFKKSSVSVAMKKLRESNHIQVSPEGYITLTPSADLFLADPSRRGSQGSCSRCLPHGTCHQRRKF